MGADDVDGSKRRLGHGGDGDQAIGPVGDGGQRIARGDGGAGRAAGPIHAGVEDAVGIARQHAIQLGRRRVAQFDQNHDVGLGFGDGTGDGLDVGVSSPEIGGVEGQRRRAFAGQGSTPRQPLGPDRQNQQDGDAEARDHARTQPHQGVKQGQSQGRRQGRSRELGQKIGPPVPDARQGGQGDGGGRGQKAQRRQMDRGLQGGDQADFLAD
ncbi:hypothetical protein D3C71_858740 [compost metagenome]